MELTAQIVTLKLAETFVIARESSDEDDVVRVELRHGAVTGYGEGAPIERYNESVASALAYLESAGQLLGDDPFALEEIEARLHRPVRTLRAPHWTARCTTSRGSFSASRPGSCSASPRIGPPTSWTVWLGDPDDMARRAEKAASRFKRL